MHRDLIITLAARHKLPTVYPNRYWITSGGLVSYGPEDIDHFRQAAGYVDRILKGENPGDLPVQQPTKFELTTRTSLPSVGRKTSAPRTCLTPLNTSPTHSPVNASLAASRPHAHDSGPV